LSKSSLTSTRGDEHSTLTLNVTGIATRSLLRASPTSLAGTSIVPVISSVARTGPFSISLLTNGKRVDNTVSPGIHGGE